MQSYEVEVKSLLGSEARADELRAALQKIDPSCSLQSKGRQLNHYFEGGDLKNLAHVMTQHLSGVGGIKLDDMAERGKDFSVRTRLAAESGSNEGSVYLVVKASVGADSSQNGVARIEFEERVPLSLYELDELVISAGFSYQAKWSRDRETYLCKDITVTLDKNAGYGWVAEFELVVSDEARVEAARQAIFSLMKEAGAEELPQERLERMFSFYNSHWQEYYGTEKIFTVE